VIVVDGKIWTHRDEMPKDVILNNILEDYERKQINYRKITIFEVANLNEILEWSPSSLSERDISSKQAKLHCLLIYLADKHRIMSPDSATNILFLASYIQNSIKELLTDVENRGIDLSSTNVVEAFARIRIRNHHLNPKWIDSNRMKDNTLDVLNKIVLLSSKDITHAAFYGFKKDGRHPHLPDDLREKCLESYQKFAELFGIKVKQ
jgi:hypothetical protein